MKRAQPSLSVRLRSNAVVKPPYKFRRGEGGIFVEIYLPKKPEFQGRLYDTLTKGFKIENVKDHFNDPEKKPGIRRLLKDYRDVVQFLGTPEEVRTFPSVLKGYSMYEVEGVFYDSRNEIQGELTQVVRIMFRPDLRKLLSKYKHKDAARIINRTAKKYLRYPGGHQAFERSGKFTPMEREVVKHVAKWANYVGLFIFGYLVYEICEQITLLCSEGKMEWDDAENEIWVTSFWNLVINPISKLKRSGRSGKPTPSM